MNANSDPVARKAMQNVPFVLVAVFGVWASCCSVVTADQDKAPSASPLRRPVAMALLGNARLCVGNRRSGSVSLLDTETLQVVSEFTCCELLADLIALPDSRHLLAVDEAAHKLILLVHEGDALRVASECRVAPYPVSVRVSGDGTKCCVASLWSRTLTTVDLVVSVDDGNVSFGASRRLSLPFAPRRQLFLAGDSKLVVADSFGGSLALIDASRWQLESVREIPGHNIRGLALTGDKQQLLVAHQILNPLARAEFPDLHWGVLMTNNVRSLAVETILDSDQDLLEGSRLNHLGDVGKGAGDPAAICLDGHGRVIVALAGVDEVAIKKPGSSAFESVTVGRRPTAVLHDPNTGRVFVANTFSDSISVLSFGEPLKNIEVELGSRGALASADRGELLFFDARLSHDRWLSCHSCHTDGHSNGLLNDNLGDNSFGAPKRVLSLLGVARTGPWAWNGQIDELDVQVRKSVATTMQGRHPSESDVADLTAYLRTLTPPPPRHEDDHGHSVSRGRELFKQRGCQECHTPPTYTSPSVYDVGLADELGVKRFNPPSLRGVGHRRTHFHDNRAKSLEAVFSSVVHQLETRLSHEDLTHLVRFLESL